MAGSIPRSPLSPTPPPSPLYGAAEPAVSVLAASLLDPPPRWVRIAVLELMSLILSGARSRIALLNCSGGTHRSIGRAWVLVTAVVSGEHISAYAYDINGA